MKKKEEEEETVVLLISGVGQKPGHIRQQPNDGSSFTPPTTFWREGGGAKGSWDCLLPSCNWIKLPSNLFRPVTLLHPREANLPRP